MEAMDQKQKNKYVRGIVLNGIILFALVLAFFLLALPRYQEMGEMIDTINATNSAMENLKNEGVNADKFQSLVRDVGRKKELPDDIFSDKGKLDRALQKPASFSGDYIAWTANEVGRIDAINSEVEENERILGNIIPSYVSMTAAAHATPVKNQVNLESFINYIEKNLLARYALTSFAPIGIDSVTFDKDKTSSVNIGSFKISLDIQGKNSDIYDFVGAVQKSGQLIIRNGKLVPDGVRQTSDDRFSGLSNLLVRIDSLTLTNAFERNSDTNNGMVVLEFYVEGMNYQKILLLRNSIATQFDSLKKAIKDTGELCSKWENIVCQDGLWNSTVAIIKNLGRQLASLQPKIDAIKKSSASSDVNAELDDLYALQSSIGTIQNIYDRNNATLKKINSRARK